MESSLTDFLLEITDDLFEGHQHSCRVIADVERHADGMAFNRLIGPKHLDHSHCIRVRCIRVIRVLDEIVIVEINSIL